MLEVTGLERAAPGHHTGVRTGIVIAPNAVKVVHLRNPLPASTIELIASALARSDGDLRA